MVQLLKNDQRFPSQIAIAIKKTHKESYSKMLKLDLYCQGCHGERNKDKTIFSVEISKQELLLENEIVHIVVKFNKKRNICLHERGKSYGQLRGYARKQSSIKMMKEKLQLRHLRQYALSNNISLKSRFTGNRQNVLTANAARILTSQIKTQKSIIERIHTAIASINENHKQQYINKNGNEAANKIKMWGFIQPPV